MRLIAIVSASVLLIGCSPSALSPTTDSDSNSQAVAGGSDLRCATSPPPTDLLEITVVTNSGPHASPYISWAEEMMCFEENGVAVTLVEAGAPSDRIAALVSGSADIIWLPNDPLIAGVANGKIDMVLVAPHVGYTAERLAEAKATTTYDGTLILDGVTLAAPGKNITDLGELEGAKIGRQSAISNIGVDFALEAAGVNLDSIQWVDVEQSERLNGLLRGDLDAAVLAGVNALKAIRGGADFLFYYQAWDRKPGIHNFWVATPEGVSDNPEAIKRFRQAMWDVYTLLADADRKREFLEFMVEVLEGEPEDVEALALPDFFIRAPIPEDIEEHMTGMFERGDIDELLTLRETSLFMLTDG